MLSLASPFLDEDLPRFICYVSMHATYVTQMLCELCFFIIIIRRIMLFVYYILRTCALLVIPSKMHVLSMGMYCFVMILIISCATIPPVKAEMLCNSPPLARATSSATFATRSLEDASGMSLLI
jgi:hypothetical protein